MTAEDPVLPTGNTCVTMTGIGLLDDIRERIEASDKNRRRLALESGVAESGLCRFVSGERPELNVGTAERLADALGMEIVLRPKRRRRPKGR